MNDILWSKQQMSRRKLANQFLAHITNTSAKRILITSVQRGDGKTRFMTSLAAELTRIGKNIVPLAFQNLEQFNPAMFRDEVVIVYGPSYRDTEGLHTIPEKWMRSFDAAVVLVMLRKTRQRELQQLISWLQEYGVLNIWPVVNQYRVPNFSQFVMRAKIKLGLYTPPPDDAPEIKHLFNKPLLAAHQEYRALPARKEAPSDEAGADMSENSSYESSYDSKSDAGRVVSVSSSRAESSIAGATLIGTASPAAIKKVERSSEKPVVLNEDGAVTKMAGRVSEKHPLSYAEMARQYSLDSRATLISSRPPAPHLPANVERSVTQSQSKTVIIKSVTKKISASPYSRENESDPSARDEFEEKRVEVIDSAQVVRVTRRSLVPPPSNNILDERSPHPSQPPGTDGENPVVDSKPIISARATIRSSVPPAGANSKKNSKSPSGNSNEESS